MKKVLSVILALMLMMQMLATFTLAAPEGEEDLILRATSVEGVVGDKVSMKLFVDNNSTGFAGIEVKALFNKAVLKLISVEFSAAVLEKFALAQAPVIDDCNASGSAALAFLSVDSNTTDDIEVATLTFEILSETPSVEVIELVDYAASFAVDANYNLVDIPMETSSGKITVKEKPAFAKGDIDMNGVINMDDAVMLTRHVLKAEVITDATSLALAEVTGDTTLNMDDAVKLTRFVLKAINTLD